MERHEFEKMKGFLLLSWDAPRSESDPNSSEGATVVFSTCRANAPTARAPIVELDNFQLLHPETKQNQRISKVEQEKVHILSRTHYIYNNIIISYI